MDANKRQSISYGCCEAHHIVKHELKTHAVFRSVPATRDCQHLHYYLIKYVMRQKCQLHSSVSSPLKDGLGPYNEILKDRDHVFLIHPFLMPSGGGSFLMPSGGSRCGGGRCPAMGGAGSWHKAGDQQAVAGVKNQHFLRPTCEPPCRLILTTTNEMGIGI